MLLNLMHRELVELLTAGVVMVEVAIIGAGQTKYGNHEKGLKGMWAESAKNAFDSVDQNFDPKLVDEAFIGSTAFGGGQLGNTAAISIKQSDNNQQETNNDRLLCQANRLPRVVVGTAP